MWLIPSAATYGTSRSASAKAKPLWNCSRIVARIIGRARAAPQDAALRPACRERLMPARRAAAANSDARRSCLEGSAARSGRARLRSGSARARMRISPRSARGPPPHRFIRCGGSFRAAGAFAGPPRPAAARAACVGPWRPASKQALRAYRYRPLHQPATVGRSCVLAIAIASAASGGRQEAALSRENPARPCRRYWPSLRRENRPTVPDPADHDGAMTMRFPRRSAAADRRLVAGGALRRRGAVRISQSRARPRVIDADAARVPLAARCKERIAVCVQRLGENPVRPQPRRGPSKLAARRCSPSSRSFCRAHA